MEVNIHKGYGARYEIIVEGHLDDIWKSWFEGLELCYEAREKDGTECTIFSFTTRDPSRLHGILAQIGAMNLTLLQVRRMGGKGWGSWR